MNTYHVTYYYLATGMEGFADIRDHGYIEANSAEEALADMGKRLYPKLDKLSQTWGLSAKNVTVPRIPIEAINELSELPKMNNYCCCTGTIHCRYCVKAKRPPHLTVDSNYTTILITDKNQITKTENMNDKLDTQERFKSAIKGKYFIVGSVDSYGSMSFSDNPRTHANIGSARAECNRLAKITPGKLYLFVQLAGAEFLPQAVATQSI